MTIKELREKIAELNTELDASLGKTDWQARHPSHISLELIDVQAELIQKLDVRPVSNAQDLPWDWDSRDSMTDEEREKALNNIA